MGHEAAYDETDKLIDELYDWMAEMGADLRAGSSLRLVKSRRAEEGRCVLATGDVEFNAELVRIPSRFILNFRFVLEDAPLVRFVEWAVAELSARGHAYRLVRLDAIYLYLVVQRLRPGARLAKFVDSMPRFYDTPEYFDARLVAVMPGCLRGDCQKRIDRLRDKYALFRDLIDEYAALNNDVDSESSLSLLAKHLDLELFRWAFCAVNSRCFHIEEADICSAEELSIGDRLFGALNLPEAAPGELATLNEYYAQKEREEVVKNNLCCMIPYLDFLNHSFKSNACGYYDKEAGAFVLRAVDVAESSDEALLFEPEPPRHAIRTGQQVYITYGHHDNKTLLLEYGFIIDENSNDRLDVTPADLTALLVLPKDEQARFESTLVFENYLSDLTCNKFTGPSWYLLKALNLACELNEPVSSDQDFHDKQPQLQQQQQRKKKKKKKLKAQHTDDIGAGNVEKIARLFERLLGSYRDDLKASLANLASLDVSVSPYHVEMTRKFCLQYLEIVEFNISLAQDPARWRELF